MTGGRHLRVLSLEDSPLDAELIQFTLADAGYEVSIDVAADRSRFEELLTGEPYDIILADFALPGFDALRALDLAKKARPGTPFICVSGAIGEEATVELLKRGADDCVLKDRMARLPFAVQSAIDERAQTASLADSERRFRSLIDHLINGYAYCRIIRDAAGEPVDFIALDVNPAFERVTGLRDAVGKRLSDMVPRVRERSPELFAVLGRVESTGTPETIEFDFKSLGTWLSISVYSTEPGTFIAVFEDITARRGAEQTLRRQEERIRQAYVDVIDAVTGGKLILLADDALAAELGEPVTAVVSVGSAPELSAARHMVGHVAESRYPGGIRKADLLCPVGEALNNALKHAGGGTCQGFARDGRLQVVITDEGPGIDFKMLPKATLVRGFSTAATLGMGFTLMLQLCERVLLYTRPGRTVVVLEVAADSSEGPGAGGAPGS